MSVMIDGTKVYTPVHNKKLIGLHKGNSVTTGINEKATTINKKLNDNTLTINRNAVMLLLSLH
ncbi:hypothetical protein CBW18_05910 [Pedobacter sp. AJM]|nr:hypothetical protein CBW18_05910 [Pedobacter sp. AJM]